MTDYSTLTKAKLLEEIGALNNQIENIPRAVNLPKPVPVPEAHALADCVRALDGVTATTRNSYSSNAAVDRRSIRRILLSLADRYEVPLIEVRAEPCGRAHVDQLDSFTLGNAVQNALANGGIA